MSKYLNALSDLFVEDVFQLLINKKFNQAKAVMKTLGMKKLDIDKDVLAETSNLQLLSTLAMLAPFNKIDKQAILESPNISTRINTINSILDLNTFQVVSNKNPNQLN